MLPVARIGDLTTIAQPMVDPNPPDTTRQTTGKSMPGFAKINQKMITPPVLGTAITGSPNVFVNNIPVHRQFDFFLMTKTVVRPTRAFKDVPLPEETTVMTGMVTLGSTSVFANKRGIARALDFYMSQPPLGQYFIPPPYTLEVPPYFVQVANGSDNVFSGPIGVSRRPEEK